MNLVIPVRCSALHWDWLCIGWVWDSRYSLGGVEYVFALSEGFGVETKCLPEGGYPHLGRREGGGAIWAIFGLWVELFVYVWMRRR